MLTQNGLSGLRAFFFEVSQNKLAVTSLFLERFLSFAFLLVFFLTPHAESCKGQHFQAPELDFAFAALADTVGLIFDAFERFIDVVEFLPLTIIEDKVNFPIPLVAR